MATQNRQITLAARPAGFPSESDFKLVSSEIPKPSERECLVQGIYLSVDPYMRGRMRDRASYVAPVKLGEVMGGGVVGRVLESRCEDFKPGDIVEGMLGWQEYAVAPAKALRKVDPTAAPISTALGVLGMPGLTAYFGLLDLSDPRPAETVVVSGAAGQQFGFHHFGTVIQVIIDLDAVFLFEVGNRIRGNVIGPVVDIQLLFFCRIKLYAMQAG